MAAAGMPKKPALSAGAQYRYLRSAYLGGNFSVRVRLAVCLEHYQSLVHLLKEKFLQTLRLSGQVMWEQISASHVFCIMLRLPYSYNFDGDLCLTFGADGEDIYIVTFTIAPGSAVNSKDSRVLLITGIQGINGKIDVIRTVTETCNNVSPAHSLMAAAEAFALSIGINTLVGIGNNQVKGGAENGARSRASFNYDAFWLPLVGEEAPAGFYYLPLPFMNKPIESIPAKHRARARKRREMRDIVRNEIMLQSDRHLMRSCLK